MFTTVFLCFFQRQFFFFIKNNEIESAQCGTSDSRERENTRQNGRVVLDVAAVGARLTAAAERLRRAPPTHAVSRERESLVTSRAATASAAGDIFYVYLQLVLYCLLFSDGIWRGTLYTCCWAVLIPYTYVVLFCGGTSAYTKARV